MPIAILGIAAFYHDSAAAIIVDGELIAAAQEERFSRIRHDDAFPENAIAYVMHEAGITYADLTAVVFYDKPFLKFERLLESFHAFAPKGMTRFITAMPVWIREKLFMKRLIRKKLTQLANTRIPILFSEHHLSHAASAFYPCPYNEAAILTIDGVGEWATTTISHGSSSGIKILRELHFPHSVGLLYSAFTYYLGFRVNSGEYKLMGLAPYGDPGSAQVQSFREKILDTLVDVRHDGSLILNMSYFNFISGSTMTNDRRWHLLFGINRREPESEIQPAHISLALAAQQVTEYIVEKLARTARELTQCPNLVMAGGVALNCVCNAKLRDAHIFENIWIQPAAGDAGGAPGAACAAYHIVYNQSRRIQPEHDAMKYGYLGPAFSEDDTIRMIRKFNATYTHIENFSDLSRIVSRQLSEGKIVAWFQGRMEFGPRALGNRSILGDPRNPAMQRRLNADVKARELFRPFAPSILEEDAPLYFTPGTPSPYMLFVQTVINSHTEIPAVTHIDHTARLHTVSRHANPRFWQLLQDFKTITGIGILINTSFNVRGQPIVCTPHDAYLTFMTTNIDLLIIGNHLFQKENQIPLDKMHTTTFTKD